MAIGQKHVLTVLSLVSLGQLVGVGLLSMKYYEMREQLNALTLVVADLHNTSNALVAAVNLLLQISRSIT